MAILKQIVRIQAIVNGQLVYVDHLSVIKWQKSEHVLENY